MKNVFPILTFWLFIGLTTSASAQLINCNPDPNGEPWWAGGLPEITPEIQAELDAIPILTLTSQSESVTLPPMVDNSQKVWFRPIFSQYGGSCGQASGVGYLFTYEINRVRDPQGNQSSNSTNQYPTHFTWNFLNEGNGSGSWYYDGWEIIKESGIPTVETYGGLWKNITGNSKVWETGYEKYYQYLQNKVVDEYHFIDPSTPLGLDILKHWINDHGVGAGTGGLANFSCYMSGAVYEILTSESAEAGKKIVRNWGTENGYHAMTIVGYNDNVKFDFNDDGQFTNPANNMGAWEIGALKVANSMGTSYPGVGQVEPDGFVYMPYRLLANITGSISPHNVHVLKVNEEYTPELTLKTQISFSCRDKLGLKAGYADNTNDINPDGVHSYFAFANHGGCWGMQGINTDPIEIGLDYNQFFGNNDVAKLFFVVSNTGSVGNGMIHNLSLIDYRWGEVFELPCSQTDVPIYYNVDTKLSINYHLLPHEAPLATDLNTNDDRVSRFTTTVPNSKTLRVATNTNIDMYNSEIHIEAGGNLLISGNNTITARRGTCKLVIDGNISVGGNVNFIAEEGAVLEIHLNNNNQAITFNATHFTGCRIYSAAQSLSFSTAVLTNCDAVHVSHGDITARYTEFYNTCLIINYLNNHNNFVAAVKYCSFFATESMPAIFMSRVENFLIQGNSMEGYLYGIEMFYCGNGQPDQQEISGNTITGSLLAGINAYNSSGAIVGLNNIYNNNFGIELFNNSNMKIAGNSSALTLAQTQQISNNTSYEVYATNCCFPNSFHYNAIIDDDNRGIPYDPLVYYDRSSSLPYQFVDISLNCWGSSFNASQDLKINNGEFDWTPSWCPGGGIPVIDAAEDMYLLAQSQADSGNYSQAKSTLQLLIEQYPESEYAQASMKELLRLENFGSTDYDSLRDYFLTNSAISADSVLTKLGNFLANKCDIELERWQDAIAWYEQQILNPVSVEDSIFAIIDLEDLYLQLENLGLKSAFACSLPLYIPENEEKYTGYRNYLLSLFPFEKDQNKPDSDIAGNKQGFLNQNSPNPFSGATEIKYCIGRTARVDISISNLTGQEIACVHQGIQDKGPYTAAFINNQLPSGFYFYSLKLDGRVVSTRKMCVCR